MRVSRKRHPWWQCLAWGCVLACAGVWGCRPPSPGGAVIAPRPLGLAIDEIQRQQEENAEWAKLIVYAHEFEINLNDQQGLARGKEVDRDQFQYQATPRPRGLRLTPDGQDHLRQIAQVLESYHWEPPSPVVVERSRTSKRWDTEHHYPLHANDELDAARRDVVVAALRGLGIENADELVVVAPAYPTGMNAVEAAAAYNRAVNNRSQSNVSQGGRGTRGTR